jgi:hypothetical protein
MSSKFSPPQSRSKSWVAFTDHCILNANNFQSRIESVVGHSHRRKKLHSPTIGLSESSVGARRLPVTWGLWTQAHHIAFSLGTVT